jgi:hypothetical protein
MSDLPPLRDDLKAILLVHSALLAALALMLWVLSGLFAQALAAPKHSAHAPRERTGVASPAPHVPAAPGRECADALALLHGFHGRAPVKGEICPRAPRAKGG